MSKILKMPLPYILLSVFAGNAHAMCRDFTGKYQLPSKYILEINQSSCDKLTRSLDLPAGDPNRTIDMPWKLEYLTDGVERPVIEDTSVPTKYKAFFDGKVFALYLKQQMAGNKSYKMQTYTLTRDEQLVLQYWSDISETDYTSSKVSLLPDSTEIWYRK